MKRFLLLSFLFFLLTSNALSEQIFEKYGVKITSSLNISHVTKDNLSKQSAATNAYFKEVGADVISFFDLGDDGFEVRYSIFYSSKLKDVDFANCSDIEIINSYRVFAETKSTILENGKIKAISINDYKYAKCTGTLENNNRDIYMTCKNGVIVVAEAVYVSSDTKYSNEIIAEVMISEVDINDAKYTNPISAIYLYVKEASYWHAVLLVTVAFNLVILIPAIFRALLTVEDTRFYSSITNAVFFLLPHIALCYASVKWSALFAYILLFVFAIQALFCLLKFLLYLFGVWYAIQKRNAICILFGSFVASVTHILMAAFFYAKAFQYIWPFK